MDHRELTAELMRLDMIPHTKKLIEIMGVVERYYRVASQLSAELPENESLRLLSSQMEHLLHECREIDRSGIYDD